MTEENPDARTRRILAERGLPPGLLPPGIVEGEIGDDGRFSVRLQAQVVRKHGAYPVRYGPTVSGVVSQGRVHELDGVAAKQIMWFPVHSIAAEGEGLVFTVGPGVKRTLLRSAFPWP